MTPEQPALAKQLVALPGFRWEAGMRAADTKFARVIATSGDPGDTESVCATEEGATSDDCYATWFAFTTATPDLTDNATGGVLLGWLAAMGMQPTADCDAACWDVGAGMPTKWRWAGNSATLAEACARALIAIGRCA
jgi:hypothetical protein